MKKTYDDGFKAGIDEGVFRTIVVIGVGALVLFLGVLAYNFVLNDIASRVSQTRVSINCAEHGIWDGSVSIGQ